VRRFGQQIHNRDQVMHTFRELVLGAYHAREVRHGGMIGSAMTSGGRGSFGSGRRG
jgi:hypothetical protein